MKNRIKTLVEETGTNLEKYKGDDYSRLDILGDFYVSVKKLIEAEAEKTFQFDCPKCGHANYLQGTPEDLVGCIFSCDGCKEKVVMRDYVERPTEGSEKE